MEGSKGLRNFVVNIKPIMEKCRDGVKLHKEEQKQIVSFYLETIHVLTSNPEKE